MGQDIRYYLDTNILKLKLLGLDDDFTHQTSNIVNSYTHILLTSSVCVHELISNCRSGSIDIQKKYDHRDIKTIIFDFLDSKDIEIVQTTRKHLELYATLPFYGEHTAPFDRLIIAQAISDHIPIITTDHLFPPYEQCGLDVIYNHK